MNDNQQKLYEFLSQRNLYSGTYEDFSNNISLVDKRKALHGMLVERQLFEGDFNMFESYLNVKKKDPIVPGLEEIAGEKRIFGDFGDTWLGDFAEDIYRSYKMNVAEGMSTDEILSMMGGDVPEEDVETWLQAIKEGEKYGMSDERIAFNKKIKEEGDTVWNTLSSYVTTPTLIFEDAIGSLSRLGAAEVDTGTITKSVATGAGIGAGVGSVVPGAGTGAGALAGGTFGLRTGIGIASGIVDATATFSGAIREELDRRGKEFTKENTVELLGDEEWVTEQRNKAIKGGAVIGVVDFITFGIAGSAAKSFTKPVAKALAAGVVEAAGGMAGEAGAQKVRGEDLSPSAILAEGFGQLGMGAISGSRKVAGKGINSFSEIINPPTYTVSGRKYTKEQFLDFINSEKDLTTDNDGNPLSIDINNDKETQKLVDEKLADHKIEKEIDPTIQGEDRARLVSLEKERRQKSESTLQSNKRRIKEIDEEIEAILSKERPEVSEDKGQAETAPSEKNILQGDPNKIFSGEPVSVVKKSVQDYADESAIEITEADNITQIDVDNAKAIADAFDQMEHKPDDPEVRASYEAMAKETMDQFGVLQKNGVKVVIYEGRGEPYKNSAEMLKDLRENNRMFILSTEKDFGTSGITDQQRAESPLLADSGMKDYNGKPLLVNDVFRAVHDFFGHGERGNSFGAIGEENAWDVHARMYSPLARRAMTTETRGQNSWVNFGPQMRNDKGQIIKKGEKGYLSPADRSFAPQKMGLLPEEMSEPGQGRVLPKQKPATPKPEAGTKKAKAEEDGALGKLRGFAERVSRKRTYNQIRKDILSNPNNYFDPQRLSEIQEQLENMTMDELIDNMNETSLTNLMQAQDQTGVMAGIEALNRATAAGDTVAAQAIVEDLAKMGTSVGRLLRHFGELKSSTVKGMYDVIIGEIEKKGTTLNDAQKQRMQELLGPLLESQKQMKALIDLRQEALSMTEEEINQMEADYKKAFEDLQKNQDSLNNWVNANISRGYGELTTMLLQGNLLTPMSQATNVFANLVNLGLAIPREFLALSASKLASIFGKGIPSDRQYSFAAYMHGVRMFGRGFAEASREVFTGKTNDYVTEWRVQRGFLPLMSFLQAVHGTGIGTKMAKKLGVEIDAPISNSQRAKLFIQATFGVPAEAMFRLLSLGDTPFRRFMEGKVIYQEAVSRGLKGEAFNRFLKYPPEEVFQEAQREGRKLTFQEKTTTSEVAEEAVKGVTGFIGEVIPPGLAQFVIRSQVPYVRTPANILSETMKYSAFPFAMASFVKKFREGKTNDAYQDFAKGMLGLMMAKVASDLIAEGLISGDIEYEEDEKKKNLAYDQFPPNSINISGLQRHLAGQDPSPQPEDRFYSYLKLGIPGVVLGSKATLQRSRIDEVEQGFDLIRQMTGIGSVSTVNHILNQSFLQGVNNLTRLIGETDEDRLATAWEKWMFGTAKAMTSVALPNTLSAMNRVEREFLPDTRVLEEMDPTSRIIAKLKHTILDRTFKLEDAVPVRTNWKGQPIQQTPTGADPFMYHMFDVLKARNAEADPVSNEVYRLYYNLEEVSKVVSTPYFARSRKINIPDISSKKEARALRALAQQTGKEYSFLFDREFTSGRIQFNTAQINKLMEVAGQDRYRLVEEVMADPRYAQMSDKKKLEVLDNVNDFYRSTIELDNRGMFRPHTVAVLDFIEEMYRNERQ